MRKPKVPSKVTKVQLRLETTHKNAIAQAARIRQTTLSQFMLEHAYQAAQQVLADQVHFTLTPNQWRAFCRVWMHLRERFQLFDNSFGTPGVFDVSKTSLRQLVLSSFVRSTRLPTSTAAFQP